MFSFRNYINKQKGKEFVIKSIDTVFGLFGGIILLFLLILILPILIIDKWLSGDK